MLRELQQHGFCLEKKRDYTLACYSPATNSFMYCCDFPLPENQLCHFPVDALMDDRLSLEVQDRPPSKSRRRQRIVQGQRQEWTIAEIVDMAVTWRKLILERGLDPGTAADQLAWSRKTAETYFTYVRNGMRQGFDFMANRFCCIGVLRDFLHRQRGRRRHRK